MSKFKSEFLNVLDERGLIFQCTNLEALDELLSKETVTAYLGCDPTGKSLHVGNLVTLMMMRRFQQCGHRPIMLIGGATARIGDPTGKDKMRKMLSDEQLTENVIGLQKSMSKFIKFGDGDNDALLVNNFDWFKDIGYLQLLSEIGPHFSINRMLSFESVKQRLNREEHMSFLEFNYMILQSYDFNYLKEKYNCMLQLCGGDQWGNVVSGVELVRRLNAAKYEEAVERMEVFGLSAPLLLTSDGKKMGKSEGNALWLNDDMLPSFDYFQYFRNVNDADVGKMLRVFTDLPMDEIYRLEKLEGQEINEAKKILAFEATKLCRGEDVASEMLNKAESIFAENSVEDLPVFNTEAEKPLFALLREAELCKTGAEARRMIKGGAVRINDEQVKDENFALTPDLKDFKLSCGKKKHVRVIVK